jgi:hypothetical protein
MRDRSRWLAAFLLGLLIGALIALLELGWPGALGVGLVVGLMASAFVRFVWPGLAGGWRWFGQASPEERKDAFWRYWP